MKQSEIIGEYIVEIEDNGSVSVSRIYKSTKKALTEIWESNGKGEVPQSWNTQNLGRHILNELCGGQSTATIGEYTIERESNQRINVIRKYSNTMDGLKDAAKEAKYTEDPKSHGWNTQNFGRNLVNYVHNNPNKEKI